MPVAPVDLMDLRKGGTRPTIFADVNNSMRTLVRKSSVPSSIIPDTEEEAVAIANDTPYGLAAYVQTGDAERASRLSRALRAGAVHINGGAYEYGSPFGGYKASGNGHEGGAMGLRFSQTKWCTTCREGSSGRQSLVRQSLFAM